MTDQQGIPDGLNEEYYQINKDILGSFNKYRPPLNIYLFKESVSRIMPYYKVGERLANHQVDELAELTDQGLVFVSRADHPVYVKHISYQLDLVLVDKNLKETEIADIFVAALTRRLEEFFDQPVQEVFKKLWVDLMVLTEYLYPDIHRCRALVRRLHTKHSLATHSVNCGFLGLGVLGRMKNDDFHTQVPRKQFDRIACGLFLHDLGMARVPAFIRDKTSQLTPDEKRKIHGHTMSGYEMLTRLDLRFKEVEECVTLHHERSNGSGYPSKLTGVSLIGGLCAVVDSFCAMISDRPYAEAKPMLQAASELGKGGLYDKRAVKGLQTYLLMDMKLKQ